ncbi:DUF2158 domain-containing protein [Chryseobacterium sp. PBS4-4]|uniref:DUF2158 domain-containing protein n=1 Tax=Chryseobacterium edaphi TaxID=2976532 RepID=A0ABT2W941_9FLAO|nr:DUF2158 domain-containing protein [Chryseobacterium edaphi]MCU7618732.1 DUF2158 domain-containing protein [Chryseobacterium edaphi]
MEIFKEGDVVQLKSGGPKMTIIEFYNDNAYANCTWYDFNTHTLHEMHSFPTLVLKLFVEDSLDAYFN